VVEVIAGGLPYDDDAAARQAETVIETLHEPALSGKNWSLKLRYKRPDRDVRPLHPVPT
jgi:hypothetical protein